MDPTGHRECIDNRCDLVWNELTQRPVLIGPIPPVIEYIYQEMTRNVVSKAAAMIRWGNFLVESRIAPAAGEFISYGVWTSQVMDANIKNYAGPFSPYLANWDHKPILRGDYGPSPVPELAETIWGTVGDVKYRYDVWSNVHYGYVGAAAGFSEAELIDGAGIEQAGTNLASHTKPTSSRGAPSFLSSWDEPSDTASIQLGVTLWQQYGLNVTPADFYLSILDNTPYLEHK